MVPSYSIRPSVSSAVQMNVHIDSIILFSFFLIQEMLDQQENQTL